MPGKKAQRKAFLKSQRILNNQVRVRQSRQDHPRRRTSFSIDEFLRFYKIEELGRVILGKRADHITRIHIKQLRQQGVRGRRKLGELKRKWPSYRRLAK